MKLVFIYGPPAVGKLTVAEKLSALSGMPLFHNHLSRDLVKDLYGEKLPDHYDLVTDIRKTVLAYCAKNDTDLIFTYVYEGMEDDDNVVQLVSSVTNNGGEVFFVELTANREDLLARVTNDSRKRFKKLTDPDILEQLTSDMDRFAIPYVEKHVINTSEYKPDDSARLILDLLKDS